jgi:hypothetical protein
MRAGALLLTTLLVSGCGSALWASVPVSGSDASLQGLAGKWEGTFDGDGTGTKGVIRFDLAQGARYADGKVIFNADDPAKATTVPLKQVEAGAAGKITGMIGPYQEPGRQVQVYTQFVGARQGNTIAGSFVTRTVDSSNHQQLGRWQMTKKL